MPDTLWSLIQEVPHSFELHHVSPGDVRLGTTACPRCRLEAWARERSASWAASAENTKFKTRAMTYRGAIADLGVPQEAPGKREEF